MIYPRSRQCGIIFIMVYSSLLPRRESLSFCACLRFSKRHNLISHCLFGRFLRQCHECKAESYNIPRASYQPHRGLEPFGHCTGPFYTQQHFAAFLCHRRCSQSPPSVSVCLLSVSVWIPFAPLLPFHNLCANVSLSTKLSNKCIQAHMNRACSQMSSPEALCKERVVVVGVWKELLKCCFTKSFFIYFSV